MFRAYVSELIMNEGNPKGRGEEEKKNLLAANPSVPQSLARLCVCLFTMLGQLGF